MSHPRANQSAAWAPPDIPAIDDAASEQVRRQIDGKAKPLGSLGRIEDLALALGVLTWPKPARINKPMLLVFAGDHGLNAEGVSQYPSAVTASMVHTYLAGRACANAFADISGVKVRVVDAGVATDFPDHPGLIKAKIAQGTANAAMQPAMTMQQLRDALNRGVDIALREIRDGADLICLGEMGIGNTASSSLIAHRLVPAPIDDCIGVGAGQTADGLARKRAAIMKAAARSEAIDPLDVLAEFGGFEIAMMVGAIFGAASGRTPVVVDGFITTAAALVAVRLNPAARPYCLFSHRSAERGHDLLLAALQAEPLLDLQLRLGEGSGALLATPLIRAAARLLTDVADLSEVLNGSIG